MEEDGLSVLEGTIQFREYAPEELVVWDGRSLTTNVLRFKEPEDERELEWKDRLQRKRRRRFNRSIAASKIPNGGRKGIVSRRVLMNRVLDVGA